MQPASVTRASTDMLVARHHFKAPERKGDAEGKKVDDARASRKECKEI